MGLPIVLTVILAAADDDGISLSQTPLTAGDLTITGALATAGVATLTAAGIGREIIITSAGDDSLITFTVYGTNPNGNSQTEVITGAATGVATGVQMFKTVTRIAVSAATAGAVKAGTNGVGATRWLPMNIHAQPVNISIGAVVTGTVNYSLNYTYSDVNAVTDQNVWIPPTVWTDTTMVNKTANNDTTFSLPINALRILLNSGTGTVAATVIQAGIIGG